jgi:autotransporter passenger strand-loop-strand repeat protein
MTTRTISSGCTVRGGRITSGNEEIILSGGGIDGSVVTGGGILLVGAGALAKDVRVTSSGDFLMSGGRAVDLTMERLSEATISGGHLVDFTVRDANANLREGAVANGTLVENGGLLVAEIGSTVDNTTLSTGGQLVVGPGASVSGVTIDNGEVTIAVGGNLSGRTVFKGRGEIYEMNDSGISLSVAGFGAGDNIGLNTFGSGKAEKLSFVEDAKKTGGVLTVTDGAHSARIVMFGQYVAAGFHAVDNGGGSSLIEYSAPASAHSDLAGGHR